MLSDSGPCWLIDKSRICGVKTSYVARGNRKTHFVHSVNACLYERDKDARSQRPAYEIYL
jgi:hypothetical protein